MFKSSFLELEKSDFFVALSEKSIFPQEIDPLGQENCTTSKGFELLLT